MLNLFNPYILIGIIFTILGAFGSGYYKGGQAAENQQQLEVAKLNAESRQKEQALVAAVNTQAIQLVKANQNAKLLQQKRNADIDSGALRLRLPVKPTLCAISATGDAPATAGVDVGTAELDGETAKALVAITDEGDAAIRKLNACISLYNQIRETLKVK